ncbi:vWA domain-containing protein [Fulvivirga lutimaris]|uniref:vWA domain-containing protein n=1 Tax=Fulvivirga lutimaris TaxID=1819566 RepID=UPI0012BC3199|nr:VWA domain-containing protein [Fulvivirga lutimaris]MTI40322.1 VWA domain-containing protein [Fulvivirga lutimaris]
MLRVTTVIALLFITTFVLAQNVQQKLPEKTRILFLLDGSASMLAKWGQETRMDVAKSLLTNLVDSLKVNPKLELALRAYGHLYSKGAQNCKDTKLEVSFAQKNHAQIIKELQLISPKGTTPIAYSLEQAANDFPAGSSRNIVIIITDGIESCDGDPCSVSLALQKKGVFLRPFVIGLGIDKDYTKEFRCLGDFFDAKDLNTFQVALQKAIKTSLEKTTATVELLDVKNKPTETNVNVSFINSVTNISAFDFVHYLDERGRPDTVTLEAVIPYDVVANTIPPVIKRNFRLQPGIHNTIELSTPQGSLNISQRSASTYEQGVKVLISKNNRLIHTQDINTTQKYLVSDYDIEVLTLPSRKFKVSVKQSQQEKITLPAPGLLNVYNNAAGYGSLYEVNVDGSQKWIKDIDSKESKSTIAIQPGNYKIVFRVEKAPGSKYTTVKNFTIKEGLSTTVRLFD